MMRTITVRGVGNVSARPDYITISMTIESIRKDYDEAMRDASERISKLQDVAVRSGYAKEDLKTTSFNVDTRYESVKDRQGNYKREFAGYAWGRGCGQKVGLQKEATECTQKSRKKWHSENMSDWDR